MWENDACMFNCLTHTIFNRTNPDHSYGNFSINSAFKYVNVTIMDGSTSSVFVGDRFGCQLSLVHQVRPQQSSPALRIKPGCGRVLVLVLREAAISRVQDEQALGRQLHVLFW